jgi:hypothetical protein
MSTDKQHTLAKKLAEVAREVAYVQKDATNSFQKYKYASAEAVLRKVNEALTSRNIALSTTAELIQYHNGEGKAPSVAIVAITLRFIDGDTSEVIAAQGLGQGADKGDKAVMKANTAALKYAYANAFTISWGDDPEADDSIDKSTKTTKKKKSKSESFKTVFTREELETELSQCGTIPNLEKIRPKIITMRGTDNYNPLVTKYKEIKKKLEEALDVRP